MVTAAGLRLSDQKLKNACRCLISRDGLSLADCSVACCSGRVNDVVVLMLMFR